MKEYDRDYQYKKAQEQDCDGYLSNKIKQHFHITIYNPT